MNTKQLPANIEAEESLIAACILYPKDYVSEVCEIVVADDFYKSSHCMLFRAISSLNSKKQHIDLVSVGEELAAQGTLQEVGLVTLATIIDTCPMSPNPAYYARLIKDKSLLRQMIGRLSESIQACLDPGTPAAETLDKIHADVLAIKPGGGVDDCFFVSDVIHQRVDMYEDIEKSKKPRGLFVGFSYLDAMTTGLQPGELTIIAARPSMGKTSFARSIVRNVSKRNKNFCTLIFSLEMSKEQLVDSDLSSESAVNMNKIRFGQADKDDWRHITNAASRMADYRIAVCDKSAPHISEIARISRQMHKKHNVGLIVVDYLQLVVGNHKENRVMEVSDVSRGLKNLARELGIPVVALSQLNRSLETRANKRPIMSDLRDSGAIEQDADVIMFIYRDEVYNPATKDAGIAEIIVGKNRNGPIGTVRIMFRKDAAAFYDLAS